MKKIKNKRKKLFYTAAAAIFWILVWHIASAVYAMDFVLPSPWTTLVKLIENIGDPSFWSCVALSTGRIFIGFALAGLLGIFFALLGIRIRIVRILLDPLCSVLRAVPVVSFIILVLVMFSSENVATVISLLMGFPLVYSSVSGGVDASPSELLEMADVFEVGFFKRLKYIYIPHLLPYIASALSVAVGLCFKSGIAAEVIGFPMGSVGEQMYLAKLGMNMPQLFSYTAVMVVISAASEKLISLLLRRLRRERSV